MRKSSKHWVGGRSNLCFSSPDKRPQDLRSSCPEMRIQSSPYSESCISASTLTAGNFGNLQMDVWNNPLRQEMFEGPRAVMSSCQGRMVNNDGATTGCLFGYNSPLEQGSGILISSRIVPNTECSNHPEFSNMPLPLAPTRSVLFASSNSSPNGHPNSFV